MVIESGLLTWEASELENSLLWALARMCAGWSRCEQLPGLRTELWTKGKAEGVLYSHELVPFTSLWLQLLFSWETCIYHLTFLLLTFFLSCKICSGSTAYDLSDMVFIVSPYLLLLPWDQPQPKWTQWEGRQEREWGRGSRQDRI